MRLINSFLFTGCAFAGNAIPKAVVDETILHRVGLGKMKGLRRSNSFDGSPREWYEFRGVRYSEEIERFDYPKYLDPAFWQVLVELRSSEVTMWSLISYS